MKKDKWNIQFRRRHFRNTIVPFSKQTLQDFSGKQNMFYILKNQEPLIPYEVPSMVLPTCLQDFNLPSYWNFQGDQSRRGKRQHAFSWEILHIEWNLLLPGYLNTIYEMSFHTLKSTLKTPDMTRFVFLNAPFSSCFPFLTVPSDCAFLSEKSNPFAQFQMKFGNKYCRHPCLLRCRYLCTPNGTRSHTLSYILHKAI